MTNTTNPFSLPNTWTPYGVKTGYLCKLGHVYTRTKEVQGYEVCREACCDMPVIEIPVCQGCEDSQANCGCAEDCPCEGKGTLYDWEGHAVMGCPVHAEPAKV